MYIDERLPKKDKDKVLRLNIKDFDEEDDEGGMSENDEGEEEREEEEKEEEERDTENDSLEGEEEGEEGGEEGEELDEEALNANNPDFLLSKTLSLKMNIVLKFLSKYLIIDIKEKKKDDKDFYKK